MAHRSRNPCSMGEGMERAEDWQSPTTEITHCRPNTHDDSTDPYLENELTKGITTWTLLVINLREGFPLPL